MATTVQAQAYIRDGRIVCVPCSDIEDREHPAARVTRRSRCSICGEPII